MSRYILVCTEANVKSLTHFNVLVVSRSFVVVASFWAGRRLNFHLGSGIFRLTTSTATCCSAGATSAAFRSSLQHVQIALKIVAFDHGKLLVLAYDADRRVEVVELLVVLNGLSQSIKTVFDEAVEITCSKPEVSRRLLTKEKVESTNSRQTTRSASPSMFSQIATSSRWKWQCSRKSCQTEHIHKDAGQCPVEFQKSTERRSMARSESDVLEAKVPTSKPATKSPTPYGRRP